MYKLLCSCLLCFSLLIDSDCFGQKLDYEISVFQDPDSMITFQGEPFKASWRYGSFIQRQGDLLIVSDYKRYYMNPNIGNPGAVYVFKMVDERWQRHQIIKCPVPNNGYDFGRQLKLTDKQLFIAFDEYKTTISGSKRSVSEVAVYHLKNDSFELNQIIDPQIEPITWFGRSIDTEDNLLVIGAQQVGRGKGYGIALVYRLDSLNMWQFEQELNGPEPDKALLYGANVYISNKRIYVSGVRSPQPIGGGELYIYTHEADSWALMQTISNPKPTKWDFYGSNVLVLNDLLLIGCSNEGKIDRGENPHGCVYVYQLRGEVYQLTTRVDNPTKGSYSQFGSGFHWNESLSILAITNPTNYPYRRTAVTTSKVHFYRIQENLVFTHLGFVESPEAGNTGFGYNCVSSGINQEYIIGAGNEYSSKAYLIDLKSALSKDQK